MTQLPHPNVAQQPNDAPNDNHPLSRRSSPDEIVDLAIRIDLEDTGPGPEPEPEPETTQTTDDYESVLDPMKYPTTRQPPSSSRRAPYKRHSPLDSSRYTNRGSMYTHFEHEEPFIRQVTKGLIVMGGYRDVPGGELPRRSAAYQQDLLVERLTCHIETINDLIGVHSRRLRAKKSFGKRIVSFLLFKPPPRNSARFEDASSPCTSSDPMDHLKLPPPPISHHLPLSQQYYRHLFDMVDHVPMLHDDVKMLISKGFAQAQVLDP